MVFIFIMLNLQYWIYYLSLLLITLHCIDMFDDVVILCLNTENILFACVIIQLEPTLYFCDFLSLWTDVFRFFLKYIRWDVNFHKIDLTHVYSYCLFVWLYFICIYYFKTLTVDEWEIEYYGNILRKQYTDCAHPIWNQHNNIEIYRALREEKQRVKRSGLNEAGGKVWSVIPRRSRRRRSGGTEEYWILLCVGQWRWLCRRRVYRWRGG